jgi:hypothetical protein
MLHGFKVILLPGSLSLRLKLEFVELENDPHYWQDDEGDNAFHIAADMAKMVRENLHWIAVMLQRPDAAVDVKNHRSG